MLNNQEPLKVSLQLSNLANSNTAFTSKADRANQIVKSTVSNSEFKQTAHQLREYLEYLKKWSPHYDFRLWDKVESQFEYAWPQLSNLIYLGIEYAG